MRSTVRVEGCLVAAALVAIAGAADAALGGIWDQCVLLVAIAVLCTAALALGRTGRPTVSLRGDLDRWLRRRAAIEGEDVDTLLDRAVASYRRDRSAVGDPEH